MFEPIPDTYLLRFAAAEILTVVAASYVGVVVRRCRYPGLARFLLATPVFVFNCWVPTLFHSWRETMTKTVFCLSHLWLANFKLAALCLNRGSLTRSWTPLQFYAIFTGPITPRDEVIETNSDLKRVGSKGTLGDPGGSTSELATRFLAKTVLLVACVYLLAAKADVIPRLALEIVYAFSLYSFLGFIMDGPASLLTSLIGLEIAPHFNQPYFSDSCASFWGKRWNLTVSNCLRGPVFDPITEGQFIHSNSGSQSKSGPIRRLIATSACFVVSGLMHELIFWYLMGQHSRQWGWLLFFSIQGPIVAIENVIRQQLKQNRIQLPWPLRVAMTIAVLLTVADKYFFPPVVLSGLADHVVDIMKQNVEGAVSLITRTGRTAL